MARRGEPVKRRELMEGDLVLFSGERISRRVGHVGIYAGEGGFLHVPGRRAGVRSDILGSPYWKPRYLGARRVLDEPPSPRRENASGKKKAIDTSRGK